MSRTENIPTSSSQTNNILDDAAAYILGAIDEYSEEAHQIREFFTTNSQKLSPTESDTLLKEYAAMIWTSQQLPASLPMLSPPREVKHRIMQAIHSDTTILVNEHEHIEFVSEFDAKGLSVYTIATDDTGWLPHPIHGIEVKPLATDKERGYSTILMRLAAKSCYPSHSHSGAEQCFVVEGSINVTGKILRAGDFLSTQAGAEHGDISSDNGATVLLVVALEDYRKSAWKIAATTFKRRLKRLVR
jgi:quercetin dioxygenase-like cupin family protein